MKSIEELVVDLQENFTDEQFEVLAQRLQGVIVKNLAICNFNYMDVDDYHQEALLTLMRCIPRYDVTVGAFFLSYFETALKRHIYNYVRRSFAAKRGQGALPQSLEDGRGILGEEDGLSLMETYIHQGLTDVSDLVILKEELQAYLSYLSPAERTYFHGYLEGWSNQDIAHGQSASLGKVQGQYDRCRAKLSKQLK